MYRLFEQGYLRLMLRAMKARFRGSRAPQEIQFLMDWEATPGLGDSSICGRHLGAVLQPPVGMSEAFVRTMKRGYVYTSDCENTRIVSKLLKNGFLTTIMRLHTLDLE